MRVKQSEALMKRENTRRAFEGKTKKKEFETIQVTNECVLGIEVEYEAPTLCRARDKDEKAH